MSKIITLFILTSLYGIHGMAAPLLTLDNTFRRENLEIDLREANSVLTVSSLEKANEIFSFFEQKITPQIPSALQEKLSKRPIKILFRKNLDKAAIFIGKVDVSDELIIQVRSTLVNEPSFFRILSHEWFHALHFAVHPDESSWMREGLAQVFEQIIFGTYNGQNLIDGLKNSTTPLNYEFKINEQNREAYGHVFIYFYYLFQKCGKQAIFWSLVESTPGSFAEQTIDYALSKMVIKPEYCSNFITTLVHAELARFHNRKIKDLSVTSDEYLIIPELSGKFETALTAKDVAIILPSLSKYEPRIFQVSALKALQKWVRTDEWAVFSLGQTTPYSVKRGLGVNPMASPPDLIFVMKTK